MPFGGVIMRGRVKTTAIFFVILSLFLLVVQLWIKLDMGVKHTTFWTKGRALTRENASQPYPSGAVLLPPKADINKLSYEDAADLYHSYVNNLQTFCGRMARLGLASDGGWEVCEDDVFRPRKPCLVYSFGINNDFSFDDDVYARYGCTVHCFDPFMKQKERQRSPGIYFHPTGLAANNETLAQGWKMRTLRAIQEELGHTTTTIDILKMDIEDSEWEALPEMLSSGALSGVRQFLWEVHLSMTKLPPSHSKYLKALHLLKDLYDAGFRAFFTHRNHWCPFTSKFRVGNRIGCHELYMIRP